MNTEEFATESQRHRDIEREERRNWGNFFPISPSLCPSFLLSLCLCDSVADTKNQAGKLSGKLAFPAFSVGECCSAYSSSATLKLICGTRYCPLTNRSVWSFSTPAASVFNSDSRNSLYFPFAKSSRYTGPLLGAGLLTGLPFGLGFAAFGLTFADAVFSNSVVDSSKVVRSGSSSSVSLRFNIVPLISRGCF